VSAGIALPKPMIPCCKFVFLATIFTKNVGERWGGGLKNIFPDINLKKG
jgi:hypothetical protein